MEPAKPPRCAWKRAIDYEDRCAKNSSSKFTASAPLVDCLKCDGSELKKGACRIFIDIEELRRQGR